jgi:hypothetical protein
MPEGLNETLAMAQRIAAVFARETGNPRQCKRFLNTFELRRLMAESRKVELKPRVLAKLMLLERFRPESFRSLADAQARQEGKSLELSQAEDALIRRDTAAVPIRSAMDDTVKPVGESARASKTSDSSVEPEESAGAAPELPPWLADEWVQEWIRSEPALGGENLQQYFYFSRDKIGAMAGAVQRLSARAQEVLSKLLHDSEAYRKNGLQELGPLSGADAAGVLNAVSERARTEEGVDDDQSALFTLLRFPEFRADMFGQVVTFLNNLPDIQIPFTVPLKLVSLAGGDPKRRPSVETLLKRWEAHASEQQLRRGATAALRRLPQ